MRNLDSKIHLPGFDRFKFQFHSFFAETFSTASTQSDIYVGHLKRTRQCRTTRTRPRTQFVLAGDVPFAYRRFGPRGATPLATAASSTDWGGNSRRYSSLAGQGCPIPPGD